MINSKKYQVVTLPKDQVRRLQAEIGPHASLNKAVSQIVETHLRGGNTQALQYRAALEYIVESRKRPHFNCDCIHCHYYFRAMIALYNLDRSEFQGLSVIQGIRKLSSLGYRQPGEDDWIAENGNPDMPLDKRFDIPYKP